MREIKALTSLRGIFAMWVLAFHMGAWSPRPGWNDLPIISRGYLAVDFFFVLSGFILATAHGAAFTRRFRLADYIDFLVKRAGRLFPLHWAVLLVVLIYLLVAGDPLPWRVHALGEAALVHRWNLFPASMSAMNGPDWSISTEWAANLFFPVFILFGMRWRLSSIVMAFVSVGAIVFVASQNARSMDAGTARSWLPLIRCFAEFGIGVLLARRPMPAWLAHDAVIVLTTAALLVAIVFKIDLLSVGLLVALLAGLTLDRGIVAQMLSAVPLHWLGRVSYSIYLTQLPTLILIRKLAIEFPSATGSIYVVGTIAAVLAVSALTHVRVELLGIEMTRKLRAKAILPSISRRVI